MTQTEIFEKMQSLIPVELWLRYDYLSFDEMAEVPELGEWAAELRQADNDWWTADDAR